jgi:hypothetical protein
LGKISLNLDTRTRDALKRFGAVELVVLGSISSIGAIIPFIGWQMSISLALFATIVVALWSWRSTEPVQLAEDVILDIDSQDGRTFVEAPAPRGMLAVANKHARELYGRDAMRYNEVENWWKRNPFVEVVLRSECGEYLGYFDVLPLTEEASRSLESGEIGEREIKPEQILGPKQMKKAKTLYLAGIAVKNAGTELGKARAGKLFCGLVEYTRFYYGDTPRHILALAATPSGERILKGIKAKIACPGTVRKDQHNLYEIWLTPDLLNNVYTRAGRRGCPASVEFKSVN